MTQRKTRRELRAYARVELMVAGEVEEIGRRYISTYLHRLPFEPCSYCGTTPPAGNTHLARSQRTLDHIHPRSKPGGGSRWSNFTPACPACNRAKANAPLLVFLVSHPLA